MGRKSKLTKDLTERICKSISEGNYKNVACQAVGIGESTLYDWLKQGEENKTGVYVEFSEAIKKAEAQAEQAHVGVIKDAANAGIWQASAWYLERKHPGRWAKKDNLDITSGGKPLSWKEFIEKAGNDD